MLGEGLSKPRKGFRGFKLDSNSPEREGEGSKGSRGVIRLGAWGGPLGAERGLRGVGVCVPSFTGCGQERAVGGWCDQGGCWGRASQGQKRAEGGRGLCAFLHRQGCQDVRRPPKDGDVV